MRDRNAFQTSVIEIFLSLNPMSEKLHRRFYPICSKPRLPGRCLHLIVNRCPPRVRLSSAPLAEAVCPACLGQHDVRVVSGRGRRANLRITRVDVVDAQNALDHFV